MFIFGYDKYDNGILEPNGLIGQDKSPEIFRLYLPPYYTEIFSRYDIYHNEFFFHKNHRINDVL